MFLHIGVDVAIFIKDIIGIFDLDSTTVSKKTKEFLKVSEEEGFIESICDDLPKSFIVTQRDKITKIYLSPISVATLKKRLNFLTKKSLRNRVDENLLSTKN